MDTSNPTSTKTETETTISPSSSQETLPKPIHHPITPTTLNSPSQPTIPHFPSIMNAYGQWGKIRSFNLCGATEKDRLCHVEMHTGYSGKPPLGTRPGVVLYDGKDSKAPILAAAGYDSYRAASSFGFNNRSVILMPPLLKGAGAEGAVEDGGLVTEQMPALVRLGRVVFVFEVEVVGAGGGGVVRRERFGWWKVGKGTDETAKEGGFKLVALPPTGNGADSLGQGNTSSYVPEGADGGEVLAFLSWRRLFPKFKHAFTLELLGRGKTGELGERWGLMVVITALRVWALRLNGKTKTGVIGAESEAPGK